MDAVEIVRAQELPVHNSNSSLSAAASRFRENAQKSVPPAPVLLLIKNLWPVSASVVFSQKAIVNGPVSKSKTLLSGIDTTSSIPSRVNASPTFPGTNVALSSKVPELVPTESSPSPSARHQPT